MQKYLILLIVLLALPAMVLAADPYVVTGVQVDVTAETAAKARDQAILDAHHRAFEILAKQLFPNKAVPKVSDKTLGNMVSDFHVEQEQANANHYVATYTFRFRQNAVRAAFGTRIIPSPRELADRLKNPGGTGNDTSIADNANLDQIIADESKKPSDQSGEVAENVSVAPAPGNAILVEVTAHNSRELDQAMARFKDVVAVREIEYVSITPEKSILRLSYDGAAEKLLGQMQSRGVLLHADTATRPPLYILEP